MILRDDVAITTSPGLSRPILDRTKHNVIVGLNRQEILMLIQDLVKHVAEPGWEKIFLLVEGGETHRKHREDGRSGKKDSATLEDVATRLFNVETMARTEYDNDSLAFNAVKERIFAIRAALDHYIGTGEKFSDQGA